MGRFSFTIILIFFFIVAKSQEVTVIEGFAPNYVGQKMALYEIEDYLSLKESKIADAEVKPDSTFNLTFYSSETRKLKLYAGKDFLDLYIQPGSEYDLYIKGKNDYNANNPNGNELTFFFGGLDSTDINYKVITFDNEVLEFLKKNYSYKSKSNVNFVEKLDAFKDRISSKYQSDTCTYFKVYVKFAIASLDNLSFKGNRNRYEKYDFYIKPETVWYNNDRYMEYILNYYEKYAFELNEKLNQEFYQGVVSSSPTMLINSLGKDYALDNVRLRELIIIKMLSDVYNDKEYPQTNIIKVLDSLSNHAIFKQNKVIARNIKDRLTDLVSGGKAPSLNLKMRDSLISLTDYKGKHLYLTFIKEGSEKSEKDFKLLKALYKKYNSDIEFFSIVLTDNESYLNDPSSYALKHDVSWGLVTVDESNSVLKKYKAVNFPYYVLIDHYGYIVAAPALSPRPNNEYETIERMFFNIKKIKDREDEEKGNH